MSAAAEHGDGPEVWLDRAVAESLAGTAAAVQSAGVTHHQWAAVAELVGQLAEAVTAGASASADTVAAADRARKGVVGVAVEMKGIRGRLRLLRSVMGGGSLACCILPLLSPTVSVSDTGRVTVVAEKEARDLPDPERYRVLADASRSHGDGDAAAWFEWKANQSQQPRLEVAGAVEGFVAGTGSHGL